MREIKANTTSASEYDPFVAVTNTGEEGCGGCYLLKGTPQRLKGILYLCRRPLYGESGIDV